MIREEDLTAEARLWWDTTVLGREYRYCLQTPSGKTTRTTETVLPVGMRVQLAVAEQAIRVFLPLPLTDLPCFCAKGLLLCRWSLPVGF